MGTISNVSKLRTGEDGKLNNTVTVCARVFPSETCEITCNKVISKSGDTIGEEAILHSSNRRYMLNQVFCQDASQAFIFDSISDNPINTLFLGNDATIFASGATGTGKKVVN